MFGPSVILVGLSFGSGEFVLWPRLTAEYGFVLFWACWVGVTLQFFLNMEIERWTLATGESAVVGFLRLSRWWGPIFLVCATVPWIWPGWATGAATLISWQLPVPVTDTAIASLIVCGLILSVGPVVYRTMEVIQLVLVAGIFMALLTLTVLLVRADTVFELERGAVDFGTIPDGIELPVLLGALAFAGAGGSVNLAQSNYIKDKGYGMGHWIGRITSPFTGREEPISEVGVVFEPTEENLARWHVWWRRTNLEHFLCFYVLALLSLALFCLLAATLLGTDGNPGADFEFLAAEADAIVFGCPTYMGSVSAGFKQFMEKTSHIWLEQGWKDKIAAGFTNSGSQSGDKLNTLTSLAVFGAQHCMVWVGLDVPAGNNSTKGSVEDLNRLGSFLGAMAQSNSDQGPEDAPPPSDRKTAEALGTRVAKAAALWNA